jgi:hypothetical protein
MAKEQFNSNTEAQQLLSTTVLKSIATHQLASDHLQKASEYHLQAITHHEAGNPEKASHSGVLAYEHFSLAEDAMIENLKLQALNK